MIFFKDFKGSWACGGYLTVVNHAAQFGRFVLEVGQLEAEFEVLLFEEGGADGDLVLLGPAGVAGSLGRFVVLPAPLPVRLVFDLVAVPSALLGTPVRRT